MHERDMSPTNWDIHAPEFARDPYPTYEVLRAQCPVAHHERYGGFWFLSRYADVKAAALDWKRFTSSVPGVTAIPVITHRDKPQLPLELDPPLHSRYRKLVQPVFSTDRIEALRPAVESRAQELTRALNDANGGDVIAQYAIPLSVHTLATFTALPADDAPLWVDWVRRMFRVEDPEDGKHATAEFGAYIDALIALRRREPREDFIGRLLASEVDGHHLTDDEVHSFLTLIFGAGFETTADALGTSLAWLADHPEAQNDLRENPALIPTAVEEFLRYFSPIQIFGRNATDDTDLGGCPIRKNDVVALGFGAANRDASVFEAPNDIRLDRSPNRHLAFGAGPHICLGAPVARLEMEVTLRQFLEIIPAYRIAENQTPEWKTRGDRRGLQRCLIEVIR